jgi:adenylate cyclase
MAGRITMAIVIAGALAGAAALGMVPLSAQLPEYGINLPENVVQSLPFGTFVAVFFVISGLSVSLIVRSVRRRRREAEAEAGEAEPMAEGGLDLGGGALNIPAFGPPAASESWGDSAVASSGAMPEETSVASPAPGGAARTARAGTSDAAAAGKNNPKLILMRFLEGVLVAIQNVVKKLDSYNMFALNLFLAGAVERLAEALTLDKGRQAEMMVQALAAVGTKADIAASFDQKLPEYRKDSKYRSMIECGRGAMDGYLVNRDDPFGGLPGAFEAWNDPTVATAVSEGIIVIMFTDMVGSTKLTHDHGDYGAQSVVRAHNAIVRAALAQHGGREVKHTGDGIMAVFFTGASAVQATIDIQHEVVRHNEGSDVMPLKIRIGLNAGKVIHEEDDYYGAAVQLAARVCAVAGPDQITVTESVMSLCKGRDFEFADRGKHSLKGIDHPVQVFEVTWNADAMA